MPASPQVTDEMVDVALDAYHSVDGTPFARPDVCMRAALTAALADHVVVPREPTKEMIAAAKNSTEGCRSVADCDRAVYRAMISAAPLPQKEG